MLYHQEVTLLLLHIKIIQYTDSSSPSLFGWYLRTEYDFSLIFSTVEDQGFFQTVSKHFCHFLLFSHIDRSRSYAGLGWTNLFDNSSNINRKPQSMRYPTLTFWSQTKRVRKGKIKDLEVSWMRALHTFCFKGFAMGRMLTDLCIRSSYLTGQRVNGVAQKHVGGPCMDTDSLLEVFSDLNTK